MCDREELGIPVLERGVPSPWDIGLPDSVYFSSPKQVIALSEPNFWTYSLQIHCNGLGPKTVTLQFFINYYQQITIIIQIIITFLLTYLSLSLSLSLSLYIYIYIYVFFSYFLIIILNMSI